jgi:hypothetical protein
MSWNFLPPELAVWVPFAVFGLLVVGLGALTIRLTNRRLPANPVDSGLYGTPKWTREPDEPAVGTARRDPELTGFLPTNRKPAEPTEAIYINVESAT